MDEEKPQAGLWARAFFPIGILRDASVGTVFERRAAVRHNVSQIPHIRTYVWRWCALTWIAIGLVEVALWIDWDPLVVLTGALVAGCGAAAVWFGALLFLLMLEGK